MRLRVVKFRASHRKQFKPTTTARVSSARVGARTPEEAHDRQAIEGRLDIEHVPLSPANIRRRNMAQRMVDWLRRSK